MYNSLIFHSSLCTTCHYLQSLGGGCDHFAYYCEM